MVCASTRLKRSITWRFSVDPRKRVLSVKLVVSTTSVSPSQWPIESPNRRRMFGRSVGRIQTNDAGVVDHLHQNHDGVARLDDLIVVVVKHRHHGRAGGGTEAQNAALRKRAILDAVVAAEAGRAHLRRGDSRRYGIFSVGRVDNQRRALDSVDAGELTAAIDEEVVVRAHRA